VTGRRGRRRKKLLVDFSKEGILVTEGRSTRSHYVEKSVWKGLFTHRKSEWITRRPAANHHNSHFKTLTRNMPATEGIVQLQCVRIHLVHISYKKLAVIIAGGSWFFSNPAGKFLVSTAITRWLNSTNSFPNHQLHCSLTLYVLRCLQHSKITTSHFTPTMSALYKQVFMTLSDPVVNLRVYCKL
jgi:hypothetical protein